MTISVIGIALALVIGVGLGVEATQLYRARQRRRTGAGRILLPFTGNTISRRTLEAAVRLAQVEKATLVPAYMATVPLKLPLDVPLQEACGTAMPLLEAIEQLAERRGVKVDSRIERGRTARDALRHLVESERFDRIVLPAATTTAAGFSARDVTWVIDNVDSEVVIFRAAPEDLTVAGAPIPARA